MSALPIIELQTAQSVGLFILTRERELGLDRCETGSTHVWTIFQNCYRPHQNSVFKRLILKIYKNAQALGESVGGSFIEKY